MAYNFGSCEPLQNVRQSDLGLRLARWFDVSHINLDGYSDRRR